MSLDEFDDDRLNDDDRMEAPLPKRGGPREPHDDDESWLTTALLGAALFVGVFGLTFGAMSMDLGRLTGGLPVMPVEASSVDYSIAALTESQLASMMLDDKRAEVEARYAIDFSTILAPKDTHAPKASRQVSAICIPRGRVETRVLPNDAHATFGLATDFLVCAMSRDTDRLCNAADREILVDQLMTYRQLREHMFGIERTRERIANSSDGRAAAKIEQRMESLIDAVEGPRRPSVAYNPRIGDALDPRIGRALQDLGRNGYLSVGDFRWMGFLAPAEYVPYLEGTSGHPACP